MSGQGGGQSYDALGATPKTAEGAQELYDSWAETYDDTLKSWKYPAPDRVAETILQFGAASSVSHILDIGCGTGLSGEALRSRGFLKLTGVDISQASLDLLQSSKGGLYDQLLRGNLDEKLNQLDDNIFDAVVSVGVLSYIENFANLFSEAIRVCKPNGLIVFTHRAPLWDEDERTVISSLQNRDIGISTKNETKKLKHKMLDHVASFTICLRALYIFIRNSVISSDLPIYYFIRSL